MTAAGRTSIVRRGMLASVTLFIVFLAGWQWGPRLLGIPAFIVPPLSMVWEEGLRMWQVGHLLGRLPRFHELSGRGALRARLTLSLGRPGPAISPARA